MRVLFTAMSITSHVQNMVPLAWELQNLGCSVRFATRPDCIATVSGYGLQPVSVGPPMSMADFMATDAVLAGLDFDIAECEAGSPDADRVQGILTWYTTVFLQQVNDDALLDDLVAVARSWQPDLVVWDALSYSGPVAARACGAAHVRMLFGLDLMARLRAGHRRVQDGLPFEARDDVLDEWLGTTLAHYGCDHDETDVVGMWTVDPLPPPLGLDTGLPGIRVQQSGFGGGAVVPAWVDTPRSVPRVCLTSGLTGREAWGDGEISLPDVLDAVADLDAEVVATLGPDEVRALRSVPDNTRIVDFVPLTALLPTCAAVVHHGGVGTVLTAVHTRTPQLVVPDRVWDPDLLARRIEDLGAGSRLDPETVTPTDLRDGVRRLLDDPSFAAGADRLGREARAAHTPRAAAARLRQFTEHHHRG